MGKSSLIGGFSKKEVKWPIRNKMAYLIIGATVFSLLMGMPISYFKAFVLDSGALDVFGTTIKSMIETYFTLIVNLIIMVVFVIQGVKRFVVKPINEIISTLEGVQGDKIDLTQRMEIHTKDEFNKLSTAFNDMIAHLTDVIGVVGDTSDRLTTSSNEVSDSANQVKDTTKEIADNMNELATRAEEGHKSVTDVSQSLIQLSSLIQMAQRKANSTNEGSAKTLNIASEGKESVQTVMARMDTIKRKTSETKESMELLDELSKEITGIAEMMTDIAKETNLLALNASIEAARAGESGKGFAVVADEVRKLAEQSTDRAEKVKDVINQMTETSSKTVLMTEESQREVLEGVDAVRLAEKSLESILSAISEMDKNVEEILDVTSQEIATSDHIVKLIDSVSSFIEETAANTEEVSASTEETVASIETVADSANTLDIASKELNESVKKFKTNDS